MKRIKSFFSNDDKDKKTLHFEDSQQEEEQQEFSIFEVIPVEDIEYMFQSMEHNQEIPQPSVEGQPSGIIQPNSTDQQKGGTQPNSETKTYSVGQPNGAGKQSYGATQQKGFGKAFIPKLLEVDTRLTIILIENTEAVAKEKDKLEKIVKNLVSAGKVCVINYGSLVREGKIVDAKQFDCSNLLFKEDIGENACLFDALSALEDVVEKNYKKIEETKHKRIRITNIDIIGIGRCMDNCSITSRESAIESFLVVAKHRDVNTKYFCLSEESFVNAATIGFHSIGSIARNYM